MGSDPRPYPTCLHSGFSPIETASMFSPLPSVINSAATAHRRTFHLNQAFMRRDKQLRHSQHSTYRCAHGAAEAGNKNRHAPFRLSAVLVLCLAPPPAGAVLAECALQLSLASTTRENRLGLGPNTECRWIWVRRYRPPPMPSLSASSRDWLELLLVPKGTPTAQTAVVEDR